MSRIPMLLFCTVLTFEGIGIGAVSVESGGTGLVTSEEHRPPRGLSVSIVKY
ncbi:Uu.00g112030.m01.CDS01 [Anthostomella pinea]|uniref:Uu.00g112030.m01.CDS01 n=1 Tax=Anthostomella pinea TaxID=933095 RepID=A0AAI8YGB7_9PEZI|nr:Uu.00g112030.m01.CDS01 [Anthostomella pinea]